jgi:two-component system sensor histidine kinase/response regulator
MAALFVNEVASRDALAMFDIPLDDWPDHLPELGQLVQSHTSTIMETWEDLIERRLPASKHTSHRAKLRDQLPQFLQKIGRDLVAGREGQNSAAQPAAREYGLESWQLGWELDLVVRDYQLLYHAILITARNDLGRELSGIETQNLARFLHDASLEAIRVFMLHRGTTQTIVSAPALGTDLFDSCSDAIIQLNVDGTIVHWNCGAERIYGWPADKIVGNHIATILPPDRRLEFDRCIAMLKNGREVPPFDTVRRRADGTDVSVSISASPIHDAAGNLQGYMSIARDISDRVRAAEALRDALEEAERASRAKSEFLANVSHELRTPMNAIIGMTELALDEELSPELRDYLETTRESADLLLSLVNDVLDISKLEAGKFVLEDVNFSLRELVDETVRGISSRAYRKGLELACNVASNVPDNLHGDPLRLRQILTNLVGNAIKFTDEGEIVVEVNLHAGSGRSCVLQFAVSDTGIGISEQDQQRVFAPFTQADASSTRRFAGTGLGLAIASHLINCFRGQFWVESEVGSGSIFFFTARFALADQDARGRPTQSTAVERLRDLPVLVADDNETNRQIIGRLLEEWHMVPVLANDAKSAMQQLEAAAHQGRPIALAVIDAIMPEHDGFELVEEIHEKDDLGTKTILMLSAADRLAFKEKCLETAYDGVLEKPISQSNLFDAIATTLGVATFDSTRGSELKGAKPPERILNVLLAEDTPANRKVVERVLAKRGHSVTAAGNGREAVDLFHQNEFDVILMDVQMPSMDGFQATDAIRKYEEEHAAASRIPIIAMTAHAMVGDRHRCLAAGMDDYISKPINIRRLIELVESYGQKGPRFRHDPQSIRIDMASRVAPPLTPMEMTDIMDLEKSLRRLDGDQSLLVDLIGFYLDDYPGLLTRIEEATAAGDAASLERAAHSMKGLVANFDAMTAKDIAQQIESRAKQRDLANTKELIEGLKQAATDLAEQLERYRRSAAS